MMTKAKTRKESMPQKHRSSVALRLYPLIVQDNSLQCVMRLCLINCMPTPIEYHWRQSRLRSPWACVKDGHNIRCPQQEYATSTLQRAIYVDQTFH